MTHMNVTLCVFSGRPNPEYKIDSNDPDFETIKAALPKPGSLHLPSVLGYQGYMITIMGNGKSNHVSCSSSIEIPCGFNQDLEKMLFNKGNFGDTLRKSVFGTLDCLK